MTQQCASESKPTENMKNQVSWIEATYIKPFERRLDSDYHSVLTNWHATLGCWSSSVHEGFTMSSGHNWIISVLNDVADYAAQNGLSKTADSINDMLAEVSSDLKRDTQKRCNTELQRASRRRPLTDKAKQT